MIISSVTAFLVIFAVVWIIYAILTNPYSFDEVEKSVNEEDEKLS